MAVDHHPPSGAVLPRKRGRPSKAEVKMSLVAQRLAMLQNNDDDDNILPVADDNPRECESENAKSIREKSLNAKQIKSCSADQKTCASTKTPTEGNDDSLFEDMILKSSANRRKYRRHKQMRVISDEESSEDRAPIVEVEPRKTKRVMEKKGKSEDSLDHEAFDDPIKCTTQNRDFVDDFIAKSSAIKRAEKVQANLSDEYPSFVKKMLRSHVTQGFWLGLPRKFCTAHLPSCDCTIALVDEEGRESYAKFLAQKSGLSGGWRAFSIEHNLQEGDVVLFQLIKPTTFKVYIVREDTLGEVDGALGLLDLDACAGRWISDPSGKAIQKEDSLRLLEENVQGTSDIDIESDVIDGVHFSDTIISFETVKNFASFNIVVDGLVIDSKFPENVRKKYYELCCSQGAFLHEHLLRGLNLNLVAGIISETINIADAIKACNASTSFDDLHIWEKTLKGLELLGMNVSFLFAQLNLLLGVGSESDVIAKSNRLRKARLDQARAVERMTALEAKLMELKENMKEVDLQLTAEVKASARKRELLIEDIVNTDGTWASIDLYVD